MLKISEILEVLEEVSPLSLQESWDNSGLLVGSREDGYEQIVLALEADSSVIENLEERSLLIVHHPLIFKPLKTLNTQSYPANLISKLISKQCALIAMHTNFDTSHLNAAFAQKLELDGHKTSFQGIELIQLQSPTTTRQLAEKIQQKTRIHPLKITDAKKEIRQVGIVCGSGYGLLERIADKDGLCFISGDIKYHEAMEALSQGVSLIDVGHYDSECHFPEILQRILQNQGYKAIITHSKNPFYYL